MVSPEVFTTIELRTFVTLADSNEKGQVVGIAHYLTHTIYQVRYVDTLGCQQERWIDREGFAPSHAEQTG